MTDVELPSEIGNAGLGKTIFGKGFQKVGQAAKVAGLAPIRAAWLAAMKLNVLNIASKLRFGYATPDVAASHGYNRTKWTMIRQQIFKAERSYVKAGGQAGNLKKAILTGNGNRGRTVSLNGLETAWQARFDRSGLWGTDASSKNSIVDLIGAILKGIAAVLDKINPGPVEDDDEGDSPE